MDSLTKYYIMLIFLWGVATNSLAQKIHYQNTFAETLINTSEEHISASKKINNIFIVTNNKYLSDDNSDLLALESALKAASANDKYELFKQVEQLKSSQAKGKLIYSFFELGYIQALFSVLDYDQSFLSELKKDKYQKNILEAFAGEMYKFNSKLPIRFLVKNLIPVDENGNVSELAALNLWTYQLRKQKLVYDNFEDFEYDIGELNNFIKVDNELWEDWNKSDLDNNDASNLLNYAVYIRRDPAMVDYIMNNYNADLHLDTKAGYKNLFRGSFYQTQDPDTQEKMLREGNLDFANREIRIVNSLLQSKTLRKKLIKFDLNITNQKHRVISEIAAFTLVCETPSDYQLGRETIDLLINNGFKADLLQWTDKEHPIYSVMDEEWETNDKKYWLAVFKGDYKKRYK